MKEKQETEAEIALKKYSLDELEALSFKYDDYLQVEAENRLSFIGWLKEQDKPKDELFEKFKDYLEIQEDYGELDPEHMYERAKSIGLFNHLDPNKKAVEVLDQLRKWLEEKRLEDYDSNTAAIQIFNKIKELKDQLEGE